jgi:hypothetical protein
MPFACARAGLQRTIVLGDGGYIGYPTFLARENRGGKIMIVMGRLFKDAYDPEVIDNLAMRLCAATISSAGLQTFGVALAELKQAGWPTASAREWFVKLARLTAKRTEVSSRRLDYLS